MKKIFILFIVLWEALISAQSVSLYNPASGAMYPDTQYFCAGESFNLKVDAVATSTGDYKITKELPSSFPLSAGSTPINFQALNSNKFSEAFPIGFTFSFYGKNYTKVVMGSNGRLVFTNDAELENLKDINTYTDRTYSGITSYNSYAKLPSSSYNKVYKSDSTQTLNLAQIFFGYTDLVPRSTNSSVTYLYKNVSVGGVNALLVSFQNQIRTNGTGLISGTSYYSNILLFQDGRIVIYVNNKTEDSYNAILGIQNDDASKFKVPDHSNTAYDYNNGPWRSEGVAWLFKPNQNLTPQFKWLRNGVQIPAQTTDTLNNFEPNDGDVLKVEVTYHDPSGAQVGAAVSDQVTFKLLQTPQISAPTYTGGCGNPAEISVIFPDPALTYEWYSETDPSFYKTGTTISAGNGSYYVQVKNTAGTCILKSASVVVNISSSLPPFVYEGTTIKECDNLGFVSKIFDLATVTDYPAGSDYSVQYFEAGSTTPITSATLNSGQTKSFSITVSTNSGVTPVCTFTKNFSLSYLSFPPDDQIYVSDKLCADVNSYSTADFKNTHFASSTFGFMFSTDGTNFTLNTVNPQTNPSVWVKITAPNFTCTSIVKLDFDMHTVVSANQPTTQLPPQCAHPTETFDLASLISEINADPDVTVTFHQSLNDAQTGVSPVSYNFRGGMGYTTLYIRVVDNITGCVAQTYPDITLLVYDKPTLIKSTIPISQCQGNTIFDLTQNVTDLVTAGPEVSVTLEYYSSAGILLTGSQISAYDEAISGSAPYIKVIYNPTCSDNVFFNLSYKPKPAALISQIPICGETTYALQDFKDKVITNSSLYIFTDEDGKPLPASFDVSSGELPNPVRFYMTNNTTGCISDLQTVTFIAGSPTSVASAEIDYELCDTDFDGITAFNLDAKKLEFTTDPAAVFEYFKDAGLSQLIPSAYTNETPFAQTVFARVTVPGYCPSVVEIHLTVNTPTKSTTLQDTYYICFGETVAIDGGTENVSWQWSTGETSQTIGISQPGNYSVILENAAGCTYTHDFVVSDANQPKIDIINQTNNSIEVITSGGVQPYRYFFNGVPQSSPVLTNPTEPYYEIQVESATGCMGPPKTVYFIKINNSFTPNGDGKNDVWKIENLDKMENVSLFIVDRLGSKVYESQGKTSVEWDGKSGGRAVASSTYWYTITWFDPVTQKNEQRQGWILLKNRN